MDRRPAKKGYKIWRNRVSLVVQLNRHFEIFDRPTHVYTIPQSSMFCSSKTYMLALAALPLFLLGPFLSVGIRPS
jgi:hypothetical protein